MHPFIQNHPGERDTRPKGNPDHNNQASLYTAMLLLCIPIAVAIPVLKRLTIIGKIAPWMMYGVIAALSLLTIAIVISMVRKMMFKNIAEQKKYYRLAGGLNWLQQEKREALQLEACYSYNDGLWVETLEYWPAEVRLRGKTRFVTFQVTTKEERLAANDVDWEVLSEKSYIERTEALFAGMHSRLFASDKHIMKPENRTAMISRLGELTQLPQNYITACWEPQGNKPPQLLWAFDLRRIVHLSRTSFMAGLISEQKAWAHILKASDYAHALFDSPDDFFNNYRLGHAYWSNDFKLTNEVSQMQKAYHNDCQWPIKNVPWTKKNSNILAEAVQNGCKEYVAEELKKNSRGAIGFQPGTKEY